MLCFSHPPQNTTLNKWCQDLFSPFPKPGPNSIYFQCIEQSISCSKLSPVFQPHWEPWIVCPWCLSLLLILTNVHKPGYYLLCEMFTTFNSWVYLCCSNFTLCDIFLIECYTYIFFLLESFSRLTGDSTKYAVHVFSFTSIH